MCSESVDQIVEKYGLQKVTLLREISIKTGIQVPAFELRVITDITCVVTVPPVRCAFPSRS